MKRLQGKAAAITGAARGIGRAIAVAYAREGAAIEGIDKAAEVSSTTAYPVATPADLTETQRLVEAEGGRFIAHQLAKRATSAALVSMCMPVIVRGLQRSQHSALSTSL